MACGCPRQQFVITGMRLFGIHASEPLTKPILGLSLSGMLRMSKFVPDEFVICASSADAPITICFLGMT